MGAGRAGGSGYSSSGTVPDPTCAHQADSRRPSGIGLSRDARRDGLEDRAFGLLMGLAVSALVINWAMISIIHLMFRRQKRANAEATSFPSFLHPFTNYVVLAFLAGIVWVMYEIPDLRLSVYLIPVWLAVLGIGYYLKKRGADAQRAGPLESR